MTIDLFIFQDGDMIRRGAAPVALLQEPPGVSRAWVERVGVEIPDGYSFGGSRSGEIGIFRDGWAMPLGVDADGQPVMIDLDDHGRYIPLHVVRRGWN